MTDFPYCKLEIFIPETHLPQLQEALRQADAGHIGRFLLNVLRKKSADFLNLPQHFHNGLLTAPVLPSAVPFKNFTYVFL